MLRTNAPRIRALLRENPDGLTAREICEELDLRSARTAYESAKDMPDTWIDRYVPVNGGFAAVFCIAVPLEDAPRPDILKRMLHTRAANKSLREPKPKA